MATCACASVSLHPEGLKRLGYIAKIVGTVGTLCCCEDNIDNALSLLICQFDGQRICNVRELQQAI